MNKRSKPAPPAVRYGCGCLCPPSATKAERQAAPGRSCKPCYFALRDQAVAAQEAQILASGPLVKLEGTEAQTTWGRRVRASLLLTALAKPQPNTEWINTLRNTTSARWFINRRFLQRKVTP